MKCGSCEAILIGGECPECRAVCEAFHALRDDEPLPALTIAIPPRSRVAPVAAGLAAGLAAGIAAAAAVALMLAAPHHREAAQVRALNTAPRTAPIPAKPNSAEPLKIKILTPDPDVVIYWVVPSKQGE